MTDQERPRGELGASTGRRRQSVLAAIGLLLVAPWCVWWALCLVDLALPWGKYTWVTIPIFGADFWTQPDWAVRIWAEGLSPYDIPWHIFHYPPIVIQLFRWALYFDPPTALRIWVVVLALLIVAGTWVAWRARKPFGIEQPPFLFVLPFVLWGFPVVFALERSNFDLITLAAMLIAMALFDSKLRHREVLAGAVLAFGPWVKIYPGLLGLALIALRRWRALAGFVLGGIFIGILEPEELVKSLRLVKKLINYTTLGEVQNWKTYFPWAHSLSMGIHKAAAGISEATGAKLPARFPSSALALLTISPLLFWVGRHVFRSPRRDALVFATMAWFVAAASFVPEVANDYSLVFLPIAAVSVCSLKDPWPILALLALALPPYQPVSFPVLGYFMLASKLCFLAAVGAALVRRAGEPAQVSAAPEGGMDGFSAERSVTGTASTSAGSASSATT